MGANGLVAKGFFQDITAPYGTIEAWFYDHFIAPAVASLFEAQAGPQIEAIPSNGHVLDVGCGGGHELAILAERRPDLRLWGIDRSAAQVVRARGRLGRFGKQVEIQEGDALALPFGDDRFDLVMSSGSIKHWPDPAKGLAECVRVLRSGGRLIIAEADRGCRHDDAVAFVKRWRTPSFAKRFDLMFFRTWVAGRSLDRDELLRHVDGLRLRDVRVDRLEGLPVLRLDGVKV